MGLKRLCNITEASTRKYEKNSGIGKVVTISLIGRLAGVIGGYY